jgi:UDP-2,3-diacylglucosamine hydrolase
MDGVQTHPVGLVAGWGRYPIVVAEALRCAGQPVCCLGVKDHADPRLVELADHFRWIGLGRLGAAVRFFRQHGVREATMAGKLHKTVLYRPWLAMRHLPDWQTLRTFWPYFFSNAKDRKDDTLLGAVVQAFDSRGVCIRPATDFVPELLVKQGQLAGPRLGPAAVKDIEFGWQLAKEMGRLDVGQSVAVKDRAVLAVEAIEGTDECIRRAGRLCAKGRFTIVKVAKPQQDMRFDVPTVGILTLQTMIEAGASVLAIEAGRTILLDEPAFRRFADQHGIAVVAVADEAAVCAEAA